MNKEKLHKIALEYYNKGRYRKSIMYCDLSLELDSFDTWALELRGISKTLLNNTEEALNDFNKLIELNPNDETIYLHRAKAFRKAYKFKEAKADLCMSHMLGDPMAKYYLVDWYPREFYFG